MAWAPVYVDIETLADDVGITEAAQIDDETERLTRAVVAASRAVDTACRRQFGVVDAPQARKYQARRSGLYGGWVLDIDDLMDLDGLLVNGLAPVIEPDLWPLNASAWEKPWTRMSAPGRGVHTITATWGWASIPGTVEAATLLQANRFFKRTDAPFGVAGSPESGSEMRLLAKVDPDVDVMLRSYKRTAVPR